MLLIGAGLLSLSAVALAQPAQRPMGPPADRTELKTRLEQRFDALDANRDGTVTVEERKAKRAEARDAMRERMFARLDTDKNGAISKDEFKAPRPHGDRAQGDARKHRGHHGHMAGARGPDAAGVKGKPMTKTAFVDAGLSRFDRIDTDRDGKISAAEREAARKAMRDRPAPANRPSPPPPGL
jgi:hypothetical protein